MTDPQRIDSFDDEESGGDLVLPSWIDAAIAKSGLEREPVELSILQARDPGSLLVGGDGLQVSGDGTEMGQLEAELAALQRDEEEEVESIDEDEAVVDNQASATADRELVIQLGGDGGDLFVEDGADLLTEDSIVEALQDTSAGAATEDADYGALTSEAVEPVGGEEYGPEDTGNEMDDFGGLEQSLATPAHADAFPAFLDRRHSLHASNELDEVQASLPAEVFEDTQEAATTGSFDAAADDAPNEEVSLESDEAMPELASAPPSSSGVSLPELTPERQMALLRQLADDDSPSPAADPAAALVQRRRLDEGWAPWMLAAIFFAGAAIVLAILLWVRPR